MASFNKVTLIGHLGSDPEMRYLDGGAAVVRFNVATTEKYTNRNGEKVEQTEWFRVEFWNDQAKLAEQYLKKGNPVYVEGRLRTETWTDKEGKERFSLSVRGSVLQFLGGREGSEGGYESPRQQAAPTPQPQAPRPAPQPAPARQTRQPEPTPFEGNGGDDDLPF
jgi:single-strand DNA-binding protein